MTVRLYLTSKGFEANQFLHPRDHLLSPVKLNTNNYLIDISDGVTWITPRFNKTVLLFPANWNFCLGYQSTIGTSHTAIINLQFGNETTMRLDQFSYSEPTGAGRELSYHEESISASQIILDNGYRLGITLNSVSTDLLFPIGDGASQDATDGHTVPYNADEYEMIDRMRNCWVEIDCDPSDFHEN